MYWPEWLDASNLHILDSLAGTDPTYAPTHQLEDMSNRLRQTTLGGDEARLAAGRQEVKKAKIRIDIAAMNRFERQVVTEFFRSQIVNAEDTPSAVAARISELQNSVAQELRLIMPPEAATRMSKHTLDFDEACNMYNLELQRDAKPAAKPTPPKAVKNPYAKKRTTTLTPVRTPEPVVVTPEYKTRAKAKPVTEHQDSKDMWNGLNDDRQWGKLFDMMENANPPTANLAATKHKTHAAAMQGDRFKRGFQKAGPKPPPSQVPETPVPQFEETQPGLSAALPISAVQEPPQEGPLKDHSKASPLPITNGMEVVREGLAKVPITWHIFMKGSKEEKEAKLEFTNYLIYVTNNQLDPSEETVREYLSAERTDQPCSNQTKAEHSEGSTPEQEWDTICDTSEEEESVHSPDRSQFKADAKAKAKYGNLRLEDGEPTAVSAPKKKRKDYVDGSLVRRFFDTEAKEQPIGVHNKEIQEFCSEAMDNEVELTGENTQSVLSDDAGDTDDSWNPDEKRKPKKSPKISDDSE